jgi:hypothetical protein
MPQFLPALAAIGCLGSWDVATGTAGVRNVDLALRVDLGGAPARPAIVLEQSFDGPGAPEEAIGFRCRSLPTSPRTTGAARKRDRRDVRLHGVTAAC